MNATRWTVTQAATACRRRGDGVRDRRAENNQQKGHTMKKLMTGLLQGRITRWSILAVVLAATGLSLAWMRPAYYKLGGAFIGSGGGIIWNAVQVPLDPAGRTAAVRVNVITYGANAAGLLTTFGADTLIDHTGQAQMTSGDSAKFSFVGYGTKQGNPPAICRIDVFTGTLTFTGPDTFVMNCTVDVYPGPANVLGLPNADADGDGFPDPGTTPVLSIPIGATAKRLLP